MSQWNHARFRVSRKSEITYGLINNRQFAHRLFQRGSLCLIALVDESMGKARLGDVISNGKCCHAVDPEDAAAAEMSRCAGCLSSEKGSRRTSGRRLAVVPGTLRYRSARQS
jgi:hypothetical protein